jgi:hypothetical protein
MSLAEPIAVTLELAAGLEELGIDYVIGGSVASSLHGIPRATQDIDIVVVLWGKHVDPFVERFESSFYVDRDMVMDAIQRRASFNIVHLATMYKVDMFVSDSSELVLSQRFDGVLELGIRRRSRHALDAGREHTTGPSFGTHDTGSCSLPRQRTRQFFGHVRRPGRGSERLQPRPRHEAREPRQERPVFCFCGVGIFPRHPHGGVLIDEHRVRFLRKRVVV